MKKPATDTFHKAKTKNLHTHTHTHTHTLSPFCLTGSSCIRSCPQTFPDLRGML